MLDMVTNNIFTTLDRLDRPPKDFEDARELIKELRAEIERRPECVVINSQNEIIPMSERDLCGLIDMTSSKFRVEITMKNGTFVFETCECVVTPSVII